MYFWHMIAMQMIWANFCHISFRHTDQNGFENIQRRSGRYMQKH